VSQLGPPSGVAAVMPMTEFFSGVIHVEIALTFRRIAQGSHVRVPAMIRLVVVLTLFAGCRISLEDEEGPGGGARHCDAQNTSSTCQEANNHSDFTWLASNVFNINCSIASGCHDGNTGNAAGRTDLRTGMSYSHLVNYSSTLEPTRKIVVPGSIEQSYLMVMLGAIPASMADPPANSPSVGLMPQGVPQGICCQKMDAIERWIMAGAPNN
jgi:hypothetical protein